jgi:ribulose kinase
MRAEPEAEQLQADIAGPLVLALDVGTSSARAMLFDRRGIAVPAVQAQTPYKMRLTPDGGVEADADALVQIVARVIDEVLVEAGPLAEQIVAVGTSCFWHSLLAVAPGPDGAEHRHVGRDARRRRGGRRGDPAQALVLPAR